MHCSAERWARNISAGSTRARCATGSAGRTALQSCWRWSPSAASATSRRAITLTTLAALAIAISGAIGVYHAGVEAEIFEGFTTCTATRGLTFEELMNVPLVRCDQVQFSFLGISMAGWNAILSLGGAAVISFLLLKGRKA